MSDTAIVIIYFFYGLAFFSMGLGILLEIVHGSDVRLRRALRPLAAFGLIHGAHEWVEMFDLLGILHQPNFYHVVLEGIRLAVLAYSFITLAAFGAFLLAGDERSSRFSLLLPLSLASIWGMGLLILRSYYPQPELMDIADVWSRYTLAIPASIAACLGLLAQQHRFRQAGMASFGRDSLWAAVAFFWYGFIGQTFTRPSPLPPSNFINQELFLELFGFPVQLLRAVAAGVAAIFVIRFMRSFEVEIKNRIEQLQEARLVEARRREDLRGELLRRVVAAQEAERQRVARELHDETGQALTAIGLGLRGASSALAYDIKKAENNLHQLENLVARSLTELQRLIADLRPSHLDDLGLAATLRWYATEVEARVPLSISVDVQGDARSLTSEMTTALFRISQEAITNTVKHADAKHIQIDLVFGMDSVKLAIMDDGCGFDLDTLEQRRSVSWGLEGMRERATLLDGNMVITSAADQGTIIEAIIPYQNIEEDQFNENSFTAGG